MPSKRNTDRLKILILGHARHGKDTAAGILQAEFDLKFTSSSYFTMQLCVRRHLAVHHYVYYETEEDCYADRVNHRSKWYSAIKSYCAVNKARLAEEILKENNIYVGMRSYEEYQASRHLFDLVLWIDASKRVPAEDSSSMSIVYNPAEMLRINNNDEITTEMHKQLVRGIREFRRYY